MTNNTTAMCGVECPTQMTHATKVLATVNLSLDIMVSSSLVVTRHPNIPFLHNKIIKSWT